MEEKNSLPFGPMTVAKAIRLSWVSLFHSAILIRLLIPVFFAIGLTIGLIFWIFPLINSDIVPYLNTFDFIHSVVVYLEGLIDFSFLFWLSIIVFIIFIFVFTYVVLIVTSAIILVPLLVPVVQRLYFPGLAKRAELSFLGSVVYTIKALFFYFLFLIILSPMIFFIPGIGQFIIPFFLNANLARQIFPYDALTDYATKEEFHRFQKDENQSLWVISLLTGGYFYIPFLNLLAAPMSALAFIIFSLGKIQDYRQTH